MSTGKTIIDVRSPMEFMGGHVAGSLNIPLSDLRDRIAEIREMPQPILLCCASGNRSGQATAFLRSLGIACENAGGWMELNYRMQQNTN